MLSILEFFLLFLLAGLMGAVCIALADAKKYLPKKRYTFGNSMGRFHKQPTRRKKNV